LGLKGVLIDFGDTLVHVDKEGNRRYEEALLSTVRKYGHQGNLGDLSSILADAYGNSTKGELKNFREFWKLFLTKLGISEQTALLEDLEEVRSNYAVAAFKLYDGVFSTLFNLQRKYKLALVSNCAIGMRDIIDALGLASYFSCIILSYEVRVRKPNRLIYLEALRKLNLEPHECIFVADEISDLEGARAVGLKTLLVRQGSLTFHEAGDQNFKPDYQCNSISKITKFL
jgi:HAD superfamily hydrolase (TIGR01509 family)